MFRLARAEERALVGAAQRGDSKALRKLVDYLSGPIYRFGRSFCGNVEDAEEVRQLVFLALLRTLKGFRGDASLSTWAYTVARNACARRRRRAAHGPVFEPLDGAGNGRAALEVPDAAQDPERSFLRGRILEAIDVALRALPSAQREVILLRDVEGLSAREAGKVLGLTERAVKSRLHRARVALRVSLAPFVEGRSRAPQCPDTARLLSRHLEGELDAAACRRMAGHIAECPNCDQACESLRSALRACGDLRDHEVTPAMRSTIRAALRKAIGG